VRKKDTYLHTWRERYAEIVVENADRVIYNAWEFTDKPERKLKVIAMLVCVSPSFFHENYAKQ
jgi:hypothetical protein